MKNFVCAKMDFYEVSSLLLLLLFVLMLSFVHLHFSKISLFLHFCLSSMLDVSKSQCPLIGLSPTKVLRPWLLVPSEQQEFPQTIGCVSVPLGLQCSGQQGTRRKYFCIFIGSDAEVRSLQVAGVETSFVSPTFLRNQRNQLVLH